MTQESEFIPTVAVVSIAGDLAGMPAADANAMFSEVLSSIATGCVSNGTAVIGHIKANFTSGDDMLAISCTTEDGNVRARTSFMHPVGGYVSTMNVIVYAISYDEMCAVIDEALKAIPGKKEIKMVREGGCDDPKCHDPACTDPKHRNIIRLG